MAPHTPRGGSPRPGGAGARLDYLDGFRGVALVFMVVNHTARWWMDGHMTWPRYHIIWITLTVAAPTFLFLVGFCLPLAVRGGESLGTLLRKFGPRGVRIVAAGLLLNALVLRDEPWYAGGVLQTIGLAIVAMAPVLWLLRYRWAPAALLAVAVAGYVAFTLAFPRLDAFVGRHPLLGLVLFYDFPPWPWLSLVLIGLVLGWSWLNAYRRSPEAGARWLMALTAVGVALLVAFVVYDWWAATPVRFGLSRDFLLDRHRTPRGASLFWVFGILFVGLGATYWVMEARRLRLRWLVVLGQTALFLYFIHQVIVFTLVNQALGWRFNQWPSFWLANAVLMVALVGLGWAWREVRPRLRGSLPWRRPVMPAAPSGSAS
ncbi:MAG TPA: heparan-alpha-glucosaminide N-acetyltransferase domain-containing protein [Methylomirabilota bacterium]|jgi:uncharacterized membrane protein